MAAEAVGDNFQQEWSVPAADMVNGFPGSLVDSHHIHPVHALVRDGIPVCFLADLGYRRSALDRRSHAVQVVLAHPQDRQFPHFRQVQGFMEIPDVGGAIPKHA